MKEKRIWILVMVGLFFYLFHYTIVFPIYILGLELYDSDDYILFSTIWYALWLVIEVVLFRIFKLTVRDLRMPFFFLLVICITAHFLYLPDKIDFLCSRRTMEKKRIIENIDNPEDHIFRLYYYTTKAPNRIPLIADKRYYIYGKPEQIATYINLNPEACFIQIDNTGWYLVYRENKYQDG